MSEPNPYESPRTVCDPPKKPDLDGFYRLRQFLLMIGPAILGGAIGYFLFAPLFRNSPEGCGAGLGGLLGLAVGIVLRITRRR